MSLLDSAQAQVLLEDATISGSAVRRAAQGLAQFLGRYLPLVGRKEMQENLRLAIAGRLSGLERKTSEPIARQAGEPRRALQRFVGAGNWDDDVVLAELRRHVREEFGDPRGVMVVDGSAFAKKGNDSCGVQRQWCGRLGKKENCQVGVFLAYAAPGGSAPLDCRLYLPKSWAKDRARRAKCHVPTKVRYAPKWKLALAQLQRNRTVPHAWVTADDEFGRVGAFRRQLRRAGETYVLDVPCNTLVRDLEEPAPRRRHRTGRRPTKPPFRQVSAWLARQPVTRWQEFEIRAGEKAPLRVRAMRTRVQTRTNKRLDGEETLVVIQTLGAEPRTHYTLSNAAADRSTDELVRAHAERHRVEEVLQIGKGEVGLGHYEVRSWVGWHHHMTLCLLAQLFLALERRRLGEKNPGSDCQSDAHDLQRTAPPAAPDLRRNRPQSQRRPSA